MIRVFDIINILSSNPHGFRPGWYIEINLLYFDMLEPVESGLRVD